MKVNYRLSNQKIKDMKKFFILMMGLLLVIPTMYSQYVNFAVENFDGNNINYKSSSGWKVDTDYYKSAPNSYLGIVPGTTGDTMVLTSPIYDFYAGSHVQVLLKFKHICKVSPRDKVQVEYKRAKEDWKPIPATCYLGEASNYLTTGFNANSYSEWVASDSIAYPSESWWKEETFDVTSEVALDDEVQFRFVITKGNTPGTNVSYGWLIDDIEILVSTYMIAKPVVEFVYPFTQNNVYNTGPFTINARVKTTTPAPIRIPWLVYTSTFEGVSATDSVEMTHVSGNELWEAEIPAFEKGTIVSYSITGSDTNNNRATTSLSYTINGWGVTPPKNSVSLLSIDSPIKGQTPANTSVPISITLRNYGDTTLNSVIINWSVNGVTQSITHKDSLLWDFTRKVTLTHYTPSPNKFDTVAVWLTMPNGVADETLMDDDSLSIITYGCYGNLNNYYVVGPNGQFSKVSDALDVIRTCQVASDITLAIESGTYTDSWDFSDIALGGGSYKLTVTSMEEDRDSVIINSSSAVGVILKNTQNVVLKDITIHTPSANRIVFQGSCEYITITRCTLLADSNSDENNRSEGISKGSYNTGIANNITITHNLINGGAGGIGFYGGTATDYAYNVRIDSNIIRNHFGQGSAIYIQYTNFSSLSYNTILGRETSSSFYGISVNVSNGPVIGNKIVQRTLGNAYYASGISLYDYNNSGATGLVANNEIILKTSSSATGIGISNNSYAILTKNHNVKILYNSIHIMGAGYSLWGIYYDNPSDVAIEIKNNNIKMESSLAYPLRVDGNYHSALNIDNNNMFAPNYVGYFMKAISTVDEWKRVMVSDKNSTANNPPFIDSSSYLALTDYTGFTCNMSSLVAIDRAGKSRAGAYSTVGCYHGITPGDIDAVLTDLSGWRQGGIVGETDTIKVLLINGGKTPLTGASIKWSFNNAATATATWSGNLALGERAIVTLGTMTYIREDYTLRAWIDNLTGMIDPNLTNDTTEVSAYVCDSKMSGVYSIGATGDFATIEEALSRIPICGIDGDISLEFEPETYPAFIDLNGVSSVMGNHKLTISSTTKNRDDVKLVGSGITLGKSDNIVIEHITLDAREHPGSVINFIDACTNVVIRHCAILLDTVSTDYNLGINNSSWTEIRNISITNNIIDGGSFGILVDYITGIFIDSNIITNSATRGIYSTYADSCVITRNTIYTRTVNTYDQWVGLYIEGNTNVDISKNRIIQLTDDIKSPEGIFLAMVYGNVTNNEINLYTETGGSGINTMYSEMNIIHNSIYMRGQSNAKGIYILDNSWMGIYPSVDVKNNLIVVESSAGYPIYLDWVSNQSFYDIDANNLYAPFYVGYVNGGLSTISAWQFVVTTDSSSVRVLPHFIDKQDNLKVIYLQELECEPFPGISDDIEGNIRNNPTVLGCYEFETYGVNARLMPLENTISDTAVSVQTILYNGGVTPITEAEIHWSLNGTLQEPFIWTGELATGERDEILLNPSLVCPVGSNVIIAWIESLGLLDDEFKRDDTVKSEFYKCVTLFYGTVSIGDNTQFSSIAEAIDQMTLCGVGGDIRLEVEPGTYIEDIDLSEISLLLNGYQLTITSATGNASDVTFQTSGTGITLFNSNNIIIEHITVDATGGNYAVNFTGSCVDVTIRHCRLLTDTVTTAGTTIPINKAVNTGRVKNISITHNILDGGYSGVYFYSGSGANEFGTNILVDSNVITNGLGYGVYLYYSEGTTSHNTILSRTENTSLNWIGIYAYECEGKIVNNYIRQRCDTIGNTTGIFTYYFHRDYRGLGLIANNEIILDWGYGISSNASNSKIIHNSISMKNPIAGVADGIFLRDVASRHEIKNNNIVIASNQGRPIYLGSMSHATTWDVDYNNMYAPNYVGYAGGYITNIDDWKQAVSTDKHSVSVLPAFVDNTKDLTLSDYTPFTCASHQDVSTDITGRNRSIPMSTMGAYQGFYPFDLAIQEITPLEVVSNQDVPLSVKILNLGNVPISKAVFNWKVNGIIQTPFTWTTSTPLNLFEETNIQIGTYTAPLLGLTPIEVWMDSVNNILDTVTWNNSISASTQVVPLARFAQPFVADVINTPSFDVYTKILEGTGATIQTPKMNIQTKGSNIISHETIDMVYENGLWIAHIPEQYYGSTVVYLLSISDTVGNAITIMDSTFIQFVPGSDIYNLNQNLTVVTLLEPISGRQGDCSPDYASVTIALANTGRLHHNFANNNVRINLTVSSPIAFSMDTILTSGVLLPGTVDTITLTNILPIIVSGQYDIKVWIDNPIDEFVIDDTLTTYYVSRKYGLPIDVDFSNDISMDFDVETNNVLYKWNIISQGVGADTAIKPQFGTGILAFSGSRGSMTTLYTRQLDLSSAIQPTLSFWYFHDTVPCDDYTDVRITVDGGITYSKLFSITKYDAVYGWREYNIDLPLFANDQCVFLAFEAMEKSKNENVTQYIDRILITAKQEIKITDILVPDLSVCDLKNKDLKIVLNNLTAPSLDYATTPLEIKLEFTATSYSFTKTIDSGTLEGFTSDTITIANGFDFAPGKYFARAYISSIFGDIFMDTIEINRKFAIEIEKISTATEPATAGMVNKQKIKITNIGNLALPNIELILTVDTATGKLSYFKTSMELGRGLAVGESLDTIFTEAFNVPWNLNYDITVYGYLMCDPTVDTTASEQEKVNIDDLYIVNIVKPLINIVDTIGKQLEVSIEVRNRNIGTVYDEGNVKVWVLITDTNGVEKQKIEGELPRIEGIAPVSYSFTEKYTVPALEKYHLTVFIENKDKYAYNDTMTLVRETTSSVNILERTGVSFTMEQNIPNPAKNETVINYNIPQDEEITFAVYSVNGQLLYSHKENATYGDNQIDLDISNYAAGIYFYMIEYKGQRLTKRMSIER